MRDSCSQNGTAIVEFAVVFPVLILLVLGVMQISLMLVARQVVEYAAFAAARAELVGEDPARAAQMICSSISGPTYTPGTGQAITVPGWGVLPRSESSSVKTTAKVTDGIADGNGTVTVEVTHLYQLFVPAANLVFGLISQPVTPGDVPDGLLFGTMNGAPHFIIRSTYTRSVPWDFERQNARPHPVISGM